MTGQQRWLAAVALALLATVACIVLVDRPAATFAHATFHATLPFVALTHIVDPVLPLSAIGFLVIGASMLLGWPVPPPTLLLFRVSVACLLAVVIKDQLKYAFGRTWPETWTNGNPSWIRDGVAAFVPFHGGTGWSSFPSGHMTLITTPAAVLMDVARPIWRAVLLVPIVLVAIGLYGADYHFVGDMVAGVLLGAVVAAIAVRALLPAMGSPAGRAAGPATPGLSPAGSRDGGQRSTAVSR